MFVASSTTPVAEVDAVLIVAKGAAATITPTYNTGYMVGDIKRSYLTSVAPGTVSSTAFAARSLFLDDTTKGIWLDPSDLGTMFQISAGGDPVTAVEQQVWLVLDKSKGLSKLQELMPSVYTGTATSGFSITTTSVTRNNSSGSINASLTLSSSLTAGKFYAVTFTASGLSGDPTVLRLGAVASGEYYKIS